MISLYTVVYITAGLISRAALQLIFVTQPVVEQLSIYADVRAVMAHLRCHMLLRNRVHRDIDLVGVKMHSRDPRGPQCCDVALIFLCAGTT